MSPERIAELYRAECFIRDALKSAFEAGKLAHMHFAPAYDVTDARAAALSWLMPDEPPTGDEDR